MSNINNWKENKEKEKLLKIKLSLRDRLYDINERIIMLNDILLSRLNIKEMQQDYKNIKNHSG